MEDSAVDGSLISFLHYFGITERLFHAVSNQWQETIGGTQERVFSNSESKKGDSTMGELARMSQIF